MPNDEPNKLLGIAPPDIVIRSTFRSYISQDFQTDNDIRELIEVMFEEPECQFYYFKRAISPLNHLINKAVANRDILMGKYEDYYYVLPDGDRNFVNIPPHDKTRFNDEYVKALVKGDRYLRITLTLSHMKRKMLEANQIAEFSRKDDNSPVELKPNIFGLGLDLKKVYRRVRGLFNKKK